MDNTQRFSGKAAVYTAARPDYAPALLDCLYAQYGFSAQAVIADIGSGTGKFAKSLLERGSRVFCVEPNADMRETAERELQGYAGFHSAAGTADNTMLASGSVDFVTAAQAFHWFDPEAFRRECLRILKPDGRVVLIWNSRDMTAPVNRESETVFRRFCPAFRGFSGGMQPDDARIVDFFRGRYERVSFPNPLCYDRERFVKRCLSGSYALREGDTGYEAYLSALEGLFDRYAQNGAIEMPNHSTAYIGKLN